MGQLEGATVIQVYLARLLVVVVLGHIVIPLAAPQTEVSKPSPLELRLSIRGKEFHVGEPITVRVELFNVGREEVFVGWRLGPIVNAPSYVKLEFKDKQGNWFPDEELTVDYSLAAINQWWIPVAAGNFYGTEIKIDNVSHPFLGTQGEYLISAKYVSKGGIAPANVEWRIPAFRVWKGELQSNSVWVEILRRPLGGKKKQ